MVFKIVWLSFPVAMMLLAQIDPSGLAGGSGWVGAGLLGAVLCWLLFVHLPNNAKRDKETAEAHAAQVETLAEQNTKRMDAMNCSHETVINSIVTANTTFVNELLNRSDKTADVQRANYAASLQLILEHCKTEFSISTERTTATLGSVEAAIVDLRRIMEEWRPVSGNVTVKV